MGVSILGEYLLNSTLYIGSNQYMIYVPGCKSSHQGPRSPNGRFSPCGPSVPEYFSEAPPFLYYYYFDSSKNEKKTQLTIPRLCTRIYI